jgi:hypothetical protein
MADSLPLQTSSTIEEHLQRILVARNWHNILLRAKVREQIVNENQKIDEQVLVEFMHNLSDEQLSELRERVFRLARDHYVACILPTLGAKPTLKPLHVREFDDPYVYKCNLMKDIVECLEYLMPQTNEAYKSPISELPYRCTCMDKQADKFEFPLGRQALVDELNAMRQLRIKLLKHQNEMNKFKEWTIGVQKLEKSIKELQSRIYLLKKQNQLYRILLTVLLIVLIVFVAVALFFSSIASSSSRVNPDL